MNYYKQWSAIQARVAVVITVAGEYNESCDAAINCGFQCVIWKL